METMKSKKKDIISSSIGNVKMVNAGQKMGMKNEITAVKKNDIYYPSINVNTKQCPDLKGMEVEQDVNMMIKGKIVSHSVDENPNRSDESFRIEIRKMGLMMK